MAREIPDVPIDWKKPTVDGGRSFDIKLITPMFGGGVETRTNDPSFPIRPTAIRGQLQFWWRATVGARYRTKQELRAAQSEIWGSTERASRVRVIVDFSEAGDPEPCARFEVDKSTHKFRSMPTWNEPFNRPSLSYALFPFQGQLANGRERIEVEPAACIRKASFRLSLHCPNDLWPQVEPALWAWLNFGGLGSRTRRGCGSVFCDAFAPKDAADLAPMWKRYMPELFPQREWPTMADQVLLRTVESPDEPVSVWDWLVGRFKHFRQGPEFARNQGSQHNRPGRSRWPEPETIRETMRADRQRSRHQRLTAILADAFPRADFGLPIIYELRGDGEPPKTSLQPLVDGMPGDRMASPLILKPLAMANGEALPVIVRLRVPPLSDVVLMQGKQEIGRFGGSAIRGPRLVTRGDQPMSYSPNGSALEAFMEFTVKNEGFTEIRR